MQASRSRNGLYLLLLVVVFAASLSFRVLNWGPAVLGNMQIRSRRSVSSPGSSQLMGKAREHRWVGPKTGERK